MEAWYEGTGAGAPVPSVFLLWSSRPDFSRRAMPSTKTIVTAVIAALVVNVALQRYQAKA